MGNSTEKENKKSFSKKCQNDKTKKERRWNMLQRKWKGNEGKNNNSTWGNKPEINGERRKIEDISTKGKTIPTKPDFTKQRKKILSATGRRWHKNIPKTRSKRNRTILD